MTIDPSLLSRDIEIIKQKRGADIFQKADEQLPIERIPIPYPTLMRITSGGIPIGCVTRLYGGTSSGKTLLAYDMIAAAQQLRSKRFPNGISCCYWNIEQQFDVQHVQNRGIDISKLYVHHARVIEDIAESMELLLSSIHLHVLDSASFASSVDELAAKPGDWLPGIHSRAWKKAINRIHSRMDREESTLIVIDHVDGGGGIGGSKRGEQPLSGKRMEYRSDLSIQLSRGAWLFYDEHGELVTDEKLKEKSKYGVGAAGLKEADGQEVSVRVPKARVCRPHRAGKMRLDLHTMHFDTAFELAEHAKFLDVDGNPAHRSGKHAIVPSNSSWFALPKRVDGEWIWDQSRRVQGERKVRDEIAQDPELQELILQAMLSEG